MPLGIPSVGVNASGVDALGVFKVFLFLDIKVNSSNLANDI